MPGDEVGQPADYAGRALDFILSGMGLCGNHKAWPNGGSAVKGTC